MSARMTLAQLLELAHASTGVVAEGTVHLLEQPPLPFLELRGDPRVHSVHVPPIANRYYTPREARMFAAALFRAADEAEAGIAPPIELLPEKGDPTPPETPSQKQKAQGNRAHRRG